MIWVLAASSCKSAAAGAPLSFAAADGRASRSCRSSNQTRSVASKSNGLSAGSVAASDDNRHQRLVDRSQIVEHAVELPPAQAVLRRGCVRGRSCEQGILGGGVDRGQKKHQPTAKHTRLRKAQDQAARPATAQRSPLAAVLLSAGTL